eukprot:SAG31_NODE_333_length_17527_cov_6.972056_9_plen_52_part_00
MLVILYAFSLLAGELAMSQGGNKKKYIEELSWLEFYGLWGVECQVSARQPL